VSDKVRSDPTHNNHLNNHDKRSMIV